MLPAEIKTIALEDEKEVAMKTATLKTASPHKKQPMLLSAGGRRATPRVQVQLRSVVYDKSLVREQMGVITDLSLSGCRVRAPMEVHPALVMELKIYAHPEWPITVKKAVVQWVKGDTFSLDFVELRQAERNRLRWVIAGIPEEAVAS
jgi:PilZ domain